LQVNEHFLSLRVVSSYFEQNVRFIDEWTSPMIA
jgi:hypothetical protein